MDQQEEREVMGEAEGMVMEGMMTGGVAITAVKMAITGMGGEVVDGMVQHTHMTTMTIPGHHPGKMTMTMT